MAALAEPPATATAAELRQMEIVRLTIMLHQVVDAHRDTHRGNTAFAVEAPSGRRQVCIKQGYERNAYILTIRPSVDLSPDEYGKLRAEVAEVVTNGLKADRSSFDEPGDALVCRYWLKDRVDYR